VWRRLVSEQFERSAKFVVALGWGTCELAFWGARPAALAFIGAALGSTEAARLYGKVRTGPPPPPLVPDPGAEV